MSTTLCTYLCNLACRGTGITIAAMTPPTTLPRPAVAQILSSPAYPDTVWNLTPTQSGKVPVAEGRGGPFNIDYEVHGKGDIKLVWIMGLGTIKSAFQRQTKEFGHDEGDKYSSLIFDNRGMGGSDKPVLRYTTSEMAKDVIELLDHLGWTEERQLNVSGVSMGGMIAQELALLIPNRINSLNLISTAAAIENTTTWAENLWTRISMFIPKSLDKAIVDGSRMLFSDAWLDSPDDTEVPTTSTPGVILPPSGAYKKWATNYERFAAHELVKRLNPVDFPRKGFILQAIAAGWHYKSADDLKRLGDAVGRERIMVMHGTADKMITLPHGRKLIEMLAPGTGLIKEGNGHVFMVEEWKWHNEMVRKMAEKGLEFNREGKKP
ncbi:uncharacterized protein BP5553_09948 [Venustampulla echinocandica]|uniref:AB hydrolase-1 domain-containing protein n=1 Tax=Venustampulla echinocandica TaxID=2656787 RepID=A0A370TB59_9HELO|nr:uncharacterized protein BP5553_09948 [Venustampulla echinocandica]RDL31159.1 hypothetical protein BP5553_09948 [Venustampulla echinocandica]